MKYNIKLISFVLLILLLNSCEKHFDSIDSYQKYINDEDNGYSETKTINGIKINVSYKPTALMVLQENTKGLKKTNDSLEKKYDNFLYFILSYSKNNKEILSTISNSREHFNNVQNELTFRMNRNISLTTQRSDTIPLIDYNLSRTYGMSQSTNLLLIFKRNELIDQEETLFLNLKDIGLSIGDLKFRFETKIIKE